MVVVRILCGIVGAAVVAGTLASAIQTVIVPRATTIRLSGAVFIAVRVLFLPFTKAARSFEQRDRALSLYAPLSLVVLPLVWLIFVTVGFTGLFIAAGVDSLRDAFITSGSSLLTLGFARTGSDLPGIVLSFGAAAIGLGLVALLIAFLPTMYAAFSAREVVVRSMSVRAGTPPSGAELLVRFHNIGYAAELEDVWLQCEAWFDELAETHTSFMALPWFRSPNPERSWTTTAGALLDGAALSQSACPELRSTQAQLCLRAGFTALAEIATAFGLPVESDPSPRDPISVARAEFDETYDRLAASGVVMTSDRDQAWSDFAGWRVNYDASLVGLAGFLAAPYAPWSSDRSAYGIRSPIRALFRR